MTNNKQQRVCHLLVASIVLTLEVLPVSAAEIAIRPMAVPRGAVVVLGDVANVRGANAAETARLEAIPLLPAPISGRPKFLRMREVQDLLAVSGEDMRELNFRGELVVEIAPAPGSENVRTLKVDRRAVWAGTSVAVPAGAVEMVESQFVKRRVAEPKLTATQMDDVKHQIEGVIFEHLNRYAARKAEWQMAVEVKPADMATVLDAKTPLKCSGGISPWTGRQRFVIAFSTERGEVRIRVVANITATQLVVVAVRPIERNRVITAADVAVEPRSNELASTSHRALADSIEAVIGLEAARAIEAGDVIYRDDARPQLLVKRGEEITVIARGGGIRVRTTARAKQDGARGDLINVESLEAKEPFSAVVTGTREAVVFTGGTTVANEKVAERPFHKLRK